MTDIPSTTSSTAFLASLPAGQLWYLAGLITQQSQCCQQVTTSVIQQQDVPHLTRCSDIMCCESQETSSTSHRELLGNTPHMTTTQNNLNIIIISFVDSCCWCTLMCCLDVMA